ncbi:hypothetical protein [Nonomuraea insulae]|uniref:Uncharacterized protein n=1 Tax=Nonomuraea insulae TaxID=1616787 RepID=A0ABW1CT48_9ACTN
MVYAADLLDPGTRLGRCVTLTGRAAPVADPGELAHAAAPARPSQIVAQIRPEPAAARDNDARILQWDSGSDSNEIFRVRALMEGEW